MKRRFFSLLRWLIAVVAMAGPGFDARAAGTPRASEPDAGSSRPRVGLVLAGGGARGIAHVGVIRLLEELGVQVDCVAGTSMGSIVGGLYASGYTSQEMMEWLEQCDWDLLLSDSLPRQQRGFRAKEEELETPRWIEFGVGRAGLKVPNAFVSGQNLLVALRERTGFVGALESFDELPVPFRAVATDVETGEMVVLDHGVLADAMRASMAVPGMFAPHPIDGRVLIDGFASRNLPVSVVRDMGADVVIAVDMRPELLPAEKLTSPFAMAEQLLSILSQRDTLEQIATLRGGDVLVRLRLPGYTAQSFADAIAIANRGYEEVQAFRSTLAALALPRETYLAREQTRRSLRRDHPVIASIEVEGSGRVNAAAVRKRISVETGEPLDPDRLRESLGRVHDLGFFKSVDYRIEDRPEGEVLVVKTEPKPWGPNFAIFGIGLGSDLDGSSELNVRTSLRFTQLNRHGGELALKTSLGTVDRLEAEFFQPMGHNGLLFLAPRAEFLRTPEAFSIDLGGVIPGVRPLPLDFQRQTTFAGLAGGLRFGTHGELRVGVDRGAVRYSDVRSASLIFVGPDGELGAFDLAALLQEYTTNRVVGSLTFDRLDDAFFPRRGYYAHGYIERESGALGTTTAGVRATAPIALGRVVIQPRLALDYTLREPEDTGRLPFRVGGLFNLSGLPTDEVFGSNAVVGALVVRSKLGGGQGASGVFVGGSLEAGNAWDERRGALPEDWIFAGSAFVAVSTPLGPVHLAVGLAERGSPTVYFHLGRVMP